MNHFLRLARGSTAPATSAKRTLFLVLESIVDGQKVFSDDQVRLVIDPAHRTPH